MMPQSESLCVLSHLCSDGTRFSGFGAVPGDSLCFFIVMLLSILGVNLATLPALASSIATRFSVRLTTCSQFCTFGHTWTAKIENWDRSLATWSAGANMQTYRYLFHNFTLKVFFLLPCASRTSRWCWRQKVLRRTDSGSKEANSSIRRDNVLK